MPIEQIEEDIFDEALEAAGAGAHGRLSMQFVFRVFQRKSLRLQGLHSFSRTY